MTSAIKVLVVDDEPLLQDLIKQHFRKQIEGKEMQFVFVKNGAEALKVINEDNAIGVILTDINMPEMDGLTLLSKISELNLLHRPVVVSAYGDMKNIRIAMNRGASDFVTKPIDFDDLKVTINKTINQYKYLRQAAKAKDDIIKFSKELEIAQNIQKLFIPSDFNPFPGNNITIYGEMTPAKEVGGDFFDFFVLDSYHLGLVIADVSGKGVPAALFMAMSHALIRTVSISSNPAECMSRVNHLLCWNNKTCMFVTMFYGIINIMTGEFRYCNAGHNYPYLLFKDGSLKKITDSKGTALGVNDELSDKNMPESPIYEEKKIILEKGDTLVLYTDGVTEASNPKFEFYGEKRFEEYLKASVTKPLPMFIDELKKDIFKFINGAEPFDDIACLALRYGPDK